MGYCVNFRPVRTGTLRGYADFCVYTGHIYHGCPVFENDLGLSIGLPKVPMMRNGQLRRTDQGGVMYAASISILDPDEMARFINMARCELLAYVRETPGLSRSLDCLKEVHSDAGC